MRFLLAIILSLFFTTNAMAVQGLISDQWQNQIQMQIAAITKTSPDIHAKGDVTMQETGTQIRATLPVFTINTADGSQWSIPSIVMTGSPNNNAVTITLPTTIIRYNDAKKEIARLTIGGQSMTAMWNSRGNFLETLNGSLRNLVFNDTIAHAQTNIGTVALSINKGSPIQIAASDVRGTALQNQKTVNSTIAKFTIMYLVPDANQTTLSSLMGLFNPSLLLAGNKEVVFSTTADQISMVSDNHTTAIQKLTTKFDLQPQGKTVNGTITGQALIVSQNPASAYSFALPRQVDLVAKVTKLPSELVSFAPGLSYSMAKSAMAETGTVIDINKLNLTTFDNGKITGTGTLKADDAVPAGFVGRMTLKIQNLKDLVAANQMQLLQPDKGTNRSGKTQSLMAMMMLQGMGKQDGTATDFVIDLTADGQSLVNGQDLSGLFGGKSKTKAIEKVPALPVTPVKGSNL